MQVFRLMGMPDKVIAFDELPKEYLEGLEMCDCTKLGRSWREFVGKVERVIKIKPEMDPITRQMLTFPAIKETAPFAYLIDWEINHDKERWGAIVEYVRRNAPVSWKQKDSTGQEVSIKMMDDLEKMAKPLARDAHSELDLEPEDVLIVPLPKSGAIEEKEGPTVEIDKKEYKCPDCEKIFDSKQGMLVHRRKKHAEPVPA